MMINILLSILSSMLLAISFKVLDNLKLNAFQAILANYYVAATMGFITSTANIPVIELPKQPWFIIAFMLGFVFILILNIISVTTQKLGITVAGVANKMSIVIPVGVAVILYGDNLNAIKVFGLILALIAVFLTSQKDSKSAPEQLVDKKLYIFPLLIFFGSGLIDCSINYAQRYYLDDNTFTLFLSVIFGTAGIIGTLTFLYNLAIGKLRIQLASLFAGVLIGFVNYFSMYFVIRCLNEKIFSPSVFFPVNNMGILAISTFAAFLIFKEKLSKTNWIGIVLALFSIFIIAFA